MKAVYIAEPGGPVTPSKAGGEPPDASNKAQTTKPTTKKPPKKGSK